MSATVPQSTTTTSSSLSSRIAVPANLSSDRGPLAESLTQGLWRFPVLSTADTLNPSSSNKSTGPIKLARDHHSEPRTPASLASIIGVKKNISDISPHEFWNRVRGIDGKEIVLVINGDLIRDRIRNWSLPCAYFTALLQAAPKHFHQTSTLAVRTSTITAPPRSLASYLKHGLQPQLPVNEASSTDDLAHVSWERSYPPAFPLLSVVISNGADGSEFLHCGFSAKLALESACESGKAIWFVVVSNEFLVEEEHWKKERSIQMFFDLDDLPSSPAQLIQIALLGPSTLLPSRLHTLRQSILHLRQGRGYHFLVDKLRGYLQRWEKFTVEPKYRERRYLIAEKEPRKPVELRGLGLVVCRGGLVGEKGMMGSGDWKKWFGDGKVWIVLRGVG